MTTTDALAYVIEPLHRVRNWMKFLAVLLFVAAEINVLSIVGLVVAPIPVTIGLFLWQAATALDAGHPGDVDRLRRATERLRHVFLTYAALGVVGLIGLAALVGFGFLAVVVDAL